MGSAIKNTIWLGTEVQDRDTMTVPETKDLTLVPLMIRRYYTKRYDRNAVINGPNGVFCCRVAEIRHPGYYLSVNLTDVTKRPEFTNSRRDYDDPED